MTAYRGENNLVNEASALQDVMKKRRRMGLFPHEESTGRIFYLVPNGNHRMGIFKLC